MSKYNPAADELSNLLNNGVWNRAIHPIIKEKITRVLEGVKITDNLITEKEQAVKQKEHLLVQKDQKIGELQKTVFVDSLNKLYPKDYPAKVENWPDTLPMKKHVVNNDVYVMEYNTKIYKEELEKKEQEAIKKEFIDILPKLYPQWYPVNVKDWPADTFGKKIINKGDYKVMEYNLPEYRKWLADKMELIEILPKIMPESYPVNYEEWTNQYAKGLLDKGDYKTIGQSLPSYRKQLVEKEQEAIKKEFVKSLNELYPDSYSTDPNEWFNKDGKAHPMKVHYDTNNFYVMGYNTKIYKKQLEEISAKKLEDAKRLKEEEEARKEQSLNDQAQELARVKELLSIKDIEAQTKDQLILAKELENQKLLIQKESEIADKNDRSFIKNQVINELQDNIGLKEKEAYKLQIELLTKQLEAAREIGKQKEINTELVEQNEILGLKMQYYDMEIKNKEAEKEIFLTQKQKLSFLVSQKEQEFQNLLIQKEIEEKELLLAKELAIADKSFEKNQVIEQLREEIEGLNKQLLDNQPIYRSIYIEDRSCQPGESLVERQMASLDLSSINLSPINHGGQNQIVNNIIGDFDNQHITHSVALGGESSESFEIIQQQSFNQLFQIYLEGV